MNMQVIRSRQPKNSKTKSLYMKPFQRPAWFDSKTEDPSPMLPSFQLPNILDGRNVKYNKSSYVMHTKAVFKFEFEIGRVSKFV